jgi:hypothetical protein
MRDAAAALQEALGGQAAFEGAVRAQPGLLRVRGDALRDTRAALAAVLGGECQAAAALACNPAVLRVNAVRLTQAAAAHAAAVGRPRMLQLVLLNPMVLARPPCRGS